MLPKKYAYIPLVILVLIAIIVGLIAWRHSKQPKTGETFDKSYGLVLKDYQGNDVHLYEFRRKVLIAYAWASWCPYCGAEIQHLSQLKTKYGDEVQIVAINRAESLQDAKAYTDKLDVSNILYLLDKDDAFFKSIGGYAMPETVFINNTGDVTFHQRGPIQIDAVEQKIQELLK